MVGIVILTSAMTLDFDLEWSEKSRVEFISRAVQTDSGTEEFIQISTSLQEVSHNVTVLLTIKET